jgi:hypothetical protein
MGMCPSLLLFRRMLMSLFRNNKVLTAVLMLGLVCALALCGIRFGHELKNSKVMLFMSTSDLMRLSADSGTDSEYYVNQFEAAGIVVADEIPLRGIVGLVEDERQYSHNPIEGFDSATYEGGMVRVFHLIPKYAARYGVLGYDGPQEIENIFYRAVTERNIRVLWMTPFTNSETGELISDPEPYVQVAENLSKRIARHGLSLGDSFSAFERYVPSPVLIIGVFWGICAACAFLCLSVFKRFYPLLIIPALAACVLLYLAAPELSVSGFALLAALAFPYLGIWHVAEKLEKTGRNPGTRTIREYLTAFACVLGISVMGGVFVGAVQSSSLYLLAIYNFRGVKLSQILPLAFAVYIIFRRLYGGNGVRGVINELLRGSKFLIALFVLVLLGGIFLFILRTGDGMLSVGVLEQRFRNWLEKVLIVRPRTKEFLVAWPCMAVAFGLTSLGGKRYAWPFAILATVGLSSVVNTFCHSRSPLWLSLTRSVLGALIGLAIGLVILVLFRGVRRNAPDNEKNSA